MVSGANIAKKSEKKDKQRIDMMQTVMDNVGVLFTWSVLISKYGNQHKYSHKVRGKKKQKKNRHLDTGVDNVGALFMWSTRIA